MTSQVPSSLNHSVVFTSPYPLLIPAKGAVLPCRCEGQQDVAVSWLWVADISPTALKTDPTPLFHHMHLKYLTRPVWENDNSESTYNQDHRYREVPTFAFAELGISVHKAIQEPH